MDNWSIEGCPVNGPRVDSKDFTVAVAWFCAYSKPMVKVAFMMDSLFMDPIVIDETSPIGRVDVAVIDENEAMVSWLDGEEVPAIKYRKVNRNGMLSPEYTLAQTSAARGSGFPQMEFYQNVLYFAWTDFVKDFTSIKVQKVVL